MAVDWPEVPEDERYRARLLDGTVKPYKDLQVGDIYQQIDSDGDIVPLENLSIEGMPRGESFAEELWARVETAPVHNYIVGRGWLLECTIGDLDSLKH